MLKLTTEHVRQNFDRKTEERGQAYFLHNHVYDFEISHHADYMMQLTADVEGSYGFNFETDVDIGLVKSKIVIFGRCTCPVGHNCKHAAAVCLFYIAQQHSKNLTDNIKKHRSVGYQWLQQIKQSSSIHPPERVPENEFLHYYLDSRPYQSIVIKKHKILKSGKLSVGNSIKIDSFCDGAYELADFMQDSDNQVAELLRGLEHRYHYNEYNIQGRLGYYFLRAVVATGRCFYVDQNGMVGEQALSFEEQSSHIQFNWEKDQGNSDQYVLTSNLPTNKIFYPTEPPCIIDPGRYCVLMLKTVIENTMLQHLITPQPVSKSEAVDLFKHMMERPELPSLPIPPQLKQQHIKTKPVPMLTLHRDNTTVFKHYIMHLYFAYDEQFVDFYNTENPLIVQRDDKFISYHRRLDLEAQAKNQMQQLGFTLTEHVGQAIFKASENGDPQAGLRQWQNFFEQQLDELKSQGWIITDNPDCDFNISNASQVQVSSESEDGWFSLKFDIEINGAPQPLVPLISHLLSEYEATENLPEQLILNTQDDQYINVNKAEITPVLNTLFELYGGKDQGELKISAFDVHLLDDDLIDASNSQVNWQGSQEVLALAQKIKTFQGIEQVVSPEALTVELRDYQQTGLNWLNFLHHFKFSGILADDMGLGKTIQTLAHLSRLKEHQQLDRPSLIVVPTSLIANWKNEIKKFTPNLSLLVFYGGGRTALIDQLDNHDLIITSYALVVRDRELHQQKNYHHIILDEAQKIKNPKTKMAKVIGSLKADYRLALSGTPIENHLGELWSIFNFLMPGFLKNLSQFKTFYQNPIEKEQDSYKQQLLNKRIKPFILRRKKEDVLDELPDKTEIIKRTQFAPAQAKLYESIRLSMEKKVRDAIADKGLNKSHITLLDALLKLRQVCCDPSLLKLKQAQKLQASAKLELFLDLLDELLAEQHKVLVFSQFTSMLSILEREIKARKINYTKLTGASKNREQIIEHFTMGDAEVFLISLKAGGVGLNLVEADTVIHYDPWWNPAVENQATDRAHRIGQNKSVFVYKLIVENTIEEKIITLQAKKQKLQDGIYQPQEGQQEQKLTGDELIELLHE